MSEPFALLWSRKSNGFHIEPLARACESGMRFFLGNIENDYLLLFTGSSDQCSSKADELRRVCDERAVVRALYGPHEDPI